MRRNASGVARGRVQLRTRAVPTCVCGVGAACAAVSWLDKRRAHESNLYCSPGRHGAHHLGRTLKSAGLVA